MLWESRDGARENKTPAHRGVTPVQRIKRGTVQWRSRTPFCSYLRKVKRLRTEEAVRATEKLNTLIIVLETLKDVTGMEDHTHQIAGVYMAGMALGLKLNYTPTGYYEKNLRSLENVTFDGS